MLPVNPETITEELESAKKLIDKWILKMNEGLPVLDQPGNEDQLELLMREFCGELRIVAGKCANLAEVLSTD
jgi:hypothetical protein